MAKKNVAVAAPVAWHLYVQIATQCAVLAARKEAGRKLTPKATRLLKEYTPRLLLLGNADMLMHDTALLVRFVAIPKEQHGAVQMNLRGAYEKQGLWLRETLDQLENALVVVGANRKKLRRPRASND